MDGNCEFGSRQNIRALWQGGDLLIAVEGDLPDPGWNVDIVQSMLDVEPPAFSLVFCRKDGVWPKVVTPYKHGEVFRIGTRRDSVRVHHADGTDDVTVEDVESAAPELAQLLGEAGSDVQEAEYDEATGLSRTFSLAEAFADAVRKLPQRNIPDAMTTVKVLEMGALFGGIAGFNHLYLRVRSGRG